MIKPKNQKMLVPPDRGELLSDIIDAHDLDMLVRKAIDDAIKQSIRKTVDNLRNGDVTEVTGRVEGDPATIPQLPEEVP